MIANDKAMSRNAKKKLRRGLRSLITISTSAGIPPWR